MLAMEVLISSRLSSLLSQLSGIGHKVGVGHRQQGNELIRLLEWYWRGNGGQVGEHRSLGSCLFCKSAVGCYPLSHSRWIGGAAIRDVMTKSMTFRPLFRAIGGCQCGWYWCDWGSGANVENM